MKRPYRTGDRFEIPIVGGRRAPGIVIDDGGEVAILALLDDAGRAAVVSRVHDRALMTYRWPVVGRASGFARADRPAIESPHCDSPETFADRAHSLLDGEVWVRPRVRVVDGVLIEPAVDPRMLRIVGKRTDVIDAAALPLDGIAILDLASVTLTHPEALADARDLRVVRLTDVRFGDDLEWIVGMSMTHLYLERAHRLDTVEPLTRTPSLKHLLVRGAWQFRYDEMDWAASFGHLDAVTVDLASRRKNAEMHRHWAPPYPDPFDRATREVSRAVA